MIGALHHGFLFDDTSARLTPMNANFGLLPELDQPVRDKKARKLAMAERGLADLDLWREMADDVLGSGE